MRYIAIFSFTYLIFSCPNLFCQQYAVIDQHAHSVEADNLKELTMALTEPFDNPTEKARAIFTWITHNIRYDIKRYSQKPTRTKIVIPNNNVDPESIIARLRKEKNEKTIKTKKGVCQDYSELFTSMCQTVGITAEVVEGVGRDLYRPFRNGPNERHAWNALLLDGKWHLVDCTWGAGVVDNGKYIRKFGDGYFLTQPALFLQNHYPDDENWQLTAHPISEADFKSQNLIEYSNRIFKLTDYAPKVSLQQGYKTIWLEFEVMPKLFIIQSEQGKKLQTEQKIEGNRINFKLSNRIKNKISIFGNHSARSSHYDLLAKYDLQNN